MVAIWSESNLIFGLIPYDLKKSITILYCNESSLSKINGIFWRSLNEISFLLLKGWFLLTLKINWGKLSRRVERTGLGKSIAFEEIVSEEGDGEEDEVVRTKSITLKPITLDEAILEMEAINHDFYMYLDTDDEQISVVYKRKEGGYGLIQATNKVNLN